MVFLPGCSQPEESVGKCNIRVRRGTGEICEDLLRIGGHVAGPGWPLVPPGEDRKRRGLRESEFLASPRTCPQSAARDCNDRAEKTTDSAATISGSNVHPLHALASPTPPAPRVRGPAALFRRKRNVARRAMPYRRGGLGIQISLPLRPAALGPYQSPPRWIPAIRPPGPAFTVSNF